VFRAVVLSIVLTLAAGPNASLVCRVWCEPHEPAVTGCQHQVPAGSLTVSDNDNCGVVTAAAVAVVSEDVRSSAFKPSAQHALIVQQFRPAPSMTSVGSGCDPRQHSPLEAQPRAIALRI